MTGILEIRNLCRSFGGVRAVKDVSFSVAEGEIVGLMGANGAGKTTLMSVIAGNVRPSSGAVLLDGEPVSGLRPDEISRRGVARTFQIVRPFNSLTVRENVATALLYGRGRMRSVSEANAGAMQILEEVDLADRAHLPASALTLAGRKRLEVARAVATSPRILLLDEVLAGLNASEVNDALAMISRLHETRRLTLIIIEHVMKALMRLSHRIVVLHNGEKVMEGPPDEVVTDPRVIQAYLGEGRFVQSA